MRLDRFLKQSRLIPRRTVAHEVCTAGALLLNGQAAKGGKLIKCGDILEWRQRTKKITLRVVTIPNFPPSKKEATTLYEVIQTEWSAEQP